MTRLRRALDLSAWINVGDEIGAAMLARRYEPVMADPPWRIDADRDGLADIHIRWPVRTRPEYSSRWLSPIRSALGTRVRVVYAEIHQPASSSTVFELVANGRAHAIVIDSHDLSGIRDHELARRSLIYFKMQHAASGYDIPTVVPGGYLADTPRFYSYLPYLRALSDGHVPLHDVYGRFGLKFAAESRRRALEILQSQAMFSFTGGTSAIGRLRFLKELARSRICIDLPGQGEFCYRLVSALAIGSCIVGPRPKNEFPVPLEPDKHVVWTQDDLSDLVQICFSLLADSDKRDRLARASRRYFDRYLHPVSLAEYYLRTSLDRVHGLG